MRYPFFFFFFFHSPPPTETYTLSLHDALPISSARPMRRASRRRPRPPARRARRRASRPDPPDRKSTRLNSSHLGISYAVFCLKKKKKTIQKDITLAMNATQAPD